MKLTPLLAILIISIGSCKKVINTEPLIKSQTSVGIFFTVHATGDLKIIEYTSVKGGTTIDTLIGTDSTWHGLYYQGSTVSLKARAMIASGTCIVDVKIFRYNEHNHVLTEVASKVDSSLSPSVQANYLIE